MGAIYNDCNILPMNEYACRLYTDNHSCYYDEKEIDSAKRCKVFTGLQTKCETPIKINLELCMQIPSTCYFERPKLGCFNYVMSDADTCNSLSK
jgi:hypothetical protein